MRKILDKLNDILADIECGATDWSTVFDDLLELRTMIEKKEAKNG